VLLGKDLFGLDFEKSHFDSKKNYQKQDADLKSA
jgi:hypothetical protein